MPGPAQELPLTAPVDVLVLGAGLAGLRAGIAALEEGRGAAGLRVRCVSLAHGPGGSSFLNLNNALGMQVLVDDEEREAYARRTALIAPPGKVDPGLVSFMAAESLPRLLELREWGVPLRDDVGQGLEALLASRKPACFLQERATAVIIQGLGRLRKAILARFRKLGGQLLENVEVLGLCRDASLTAVNVRGALLRRKGGRRFHVAPARSVVMALGGPAPLYEQNICGPAVQGLSYALLERAGAPVLQAGLLQFLWHMLEPRRFLSPHILAKRRWQARRAGVHTGAATGLDIPDQARSLAPSRAAHCPYAYGFRDSALDRFFLGQAGAGGVVMMRSRAERESGAWHKAAIMAQAGNGGAAIDRHGRTCVDGLMACGECATGMHGANRIGGGMVLATQVFGAAAGKSAAFEAGGRGDPNPENLAVCGEDGSPPQYVSHHSDPALRRRVRRLMQQHAVCGGDPGALPAVKAELDSFLEQELSRRDRLFCESAAIVVRHLMTLPRPLEVAASGE